MEVVGSIGYKSEELFTIIKIDFSTLKKGDYYVLEDRPLTIMRCLSDYNPGPNSYGHCGWVSCEEVQFEYLK